MAFRHASGRNVTGERHLNLEGAGWQVCQLGSGVQQFSSIIGRNMARTISKRRPVKAKKSYTLSAESVAYLEGLRKQRRATSASSVLEDILQHVRQASRKMALEQAVTDYYSSLGDDELDEQAKWADFAWAEFSHASE